MIRKSATLLATLNKIVETISTISGNVFKLRWNTISREEENLIKIN